LPFIHPPLMVEEGVCFFTPVIRCQYPNVVNEFFPFFLGYMWQCQVNLK